MFTTNAIARGCCIAATTLIVVLGDGVRDTFGQESEKPLTEAGRVEFLRDVLPILRERCHKCHGGVHREGELSLLTRQDAAAVLPSGAVAIAPGEPESSELLRRVTASDESQRMPPAGEPLTPNERDVLRRWITEGAEWEQHWSYRSLLRPDPPHASTAQMWPRNTIDQFVLDRLNAAAVQPSLDAERFTLIRRLYLDLTGLLPRTEEVNAFCHDPRPDAYERVVDQLLASPHVGERWGRHWLDQARYADTDGFEVDGPRNTAWLWRDWVIDALNDDMPFDQFTFEQIAGDRIPNATPRQRLATGFHRQSLTNKEGGIDQAEARYRELVDRVSAVGTIWFGMTVGCAQCHNHPYDPLTQREFFELYAFFNQSDDSDLPIPADQADFSHAKRRKSSGKKGADSFAAQVVARADEFRPTTIYQRGDFLQPGENVVPTVFGALHSAAPDRNGEAGAVAVGSGLNEEQKPRSTNRDVAAVGSDRLDLARWIIDPENPRTPRVAVNQLWIRLFGAGLVRTPDDFGAHGDRPADPRLLDWLAVEYQARGWSTKQLIRLIVTSATYRQSSKHRRGVQSLDPLNELWHRQNRYRVEAEIVHDLNLAAAGLLTAEIGGPSFYPPLADEVAKLSFRSNYVWKASTGSERYRRGMYIFYKRTLPHPNLDTLDCPDATAARMQREASNNPLQALVTLNNEVYWEAAQALAQQVFTGTMPDDRHRIDYVFRRCLSRPPTDQEQRTVEKLLAASRRWYQQHAQEARDMLGSYASPATDASDAAAWVVVCNVVLNMDEFLSRE